MFSGPSGTAASTPPSQSTSAGSACGIRVCIHPRLGYTTFLNISNTEIIRKTHATKRTIVPGHFTRRAAALIRHPTYSTDIAFVIWVVLLWCTCVPAPVCYGVPVFHVDSHRWSYIVQTMINNQTSLFVSVDASILDACRSVIFLTAVSQTFTTARQ